MTFQFGSVSELIGRCLMDHGRFDEAASEFRAALDLPAVNGDAALSLRFDLGLVLEAAGQLDEALDQFENIYRERPSYHDAAAKISALRRMLENE